MLRRGPGQPELNSVKPATAFAPGRWSNPVGGSASKFAGVTLRASPIMVPKMPIRRSLSASVAPIVLMLLFALMPRLAVGEDATPSKIVSVWPDQPPAWVVPDGPEIDRTKDSDNLVAGRRLMRIGNVSKVELHVFEAKDETGSPSPVCVVIAPGGGFSILAFDLEGLEIARQLQDAGISAAVLKYRVPTRSMDKPWKPVVQDMQRAISIIRAGKVFSNRPERVGLMGFSAGGKATVHASTSGERQYASLDDSDQSIRRPDFACLVYPAWIVEDDDSSKLRDGIVIDDQTPPMFFAHADNDPHQVLNSVALYQTLHRVGTPAALHVFTGSGHGFGGRIDGRADDLWPELCIRWIRDNGWLANVSSTKDSP